MPQLMPSVVTEDRTTAESVSALLPSETARTTLDSPYIAIGSPPPPLPSPPLTKSVLNATTKNLLTTPNPTTPFAPLPIPKSTTSLLLNQSLLLYSLLSLREWPEVGDEEGSKAMQKIWEEVWEGLGDRKVLEEWAKRQEVVWERRSLGGESRKAVFV
jgi:hypothetical protein